jgi:hypothetical protein
MKIEFHDIIYDIHVGVFRVEFCAYIYIYYTFSVLQYNVANILIIELIISNMMHLLSGVCISLTNCAPPSECKFCTDCFCILRISINNFIFSITFFTYSLN